MGRRRFHPLSVSILLLLLAAGAVSAQGDHGRNHGGRNFNNANGNNHRVAPQFRRGPEGVMHLSPEERQTFRRNAERWLQMNAQQQNALRQREKALQEQRRREAESFLRDSGLRLENNAREQFEQRYLQERIRIERALRQEIEAKRQQELPALRERLKNEFQPHQASPAGTTSPAISARPSGN